MAALATDAADYGYYAPHHALIPHWAVAVAIVVCVAAAIVLLRDA